MNRLHLSNKALSFTPKISYDYLIIVDHKGNWSTFLLQDPLGWIAANLRVDSFGSHHTCHLWLSFPVAQVAHCSVFSLAGTTSYPEGFPSLPHQSWPPFPLNGTALPVWFYFHRNVETFEDRSKHINFKCIIISSLPFGWLCKIYLVSLLETLTVRRLLS